jgi:cytochrome c
MKVFNPFPSKRRLLPVLILMLVIFLLAAGCGRRDVPRIEGDIIPAGDPDRGREAMTEYGCIACHTIPGVTRGDATVGPSLEDWAERTTIAGRFPNTPEYLINWIMNPQEMDPGNVMPDVGVPEVIARDMAAYLYTLSRGPALWHQR